jgi:hypothetical protein
MANASQETTLLHEEVKAEQKIFRVSLKENHRGRFVRITEETRNNHSTIIIPLSGLEDFKAALQKISQAATG